jgi:hypothetical protein
LAIGLVVSPLGGGVVVLKMIVSEYVELMNPALFLIW